MTFSIAARCDETGMFGMAITTSSIAVGARCCYAKPGVGAALTQHRTDPRIGPDILARMEAGLPAQEAVDAAAAEAENIGWRQLAAVDEAGRTGYFHGAKIYSIHGAAEGPGCVAVGNIIDNDTVPGQMIAAYLAQPSKPFAERLVDALDGGLTAGGETQDVHSAALYIVHVQPFPYMDLRIDWADEPIGALRALLQRYEGQADAFVTKVLDPDNVPPETELQALADARMSQSS